MNNLDTFCAALTRHYESLYVSEPETCGLAAARYTPAELARKMTLGLSSGNANKDGSGIKRTCAELHIPYTYKAIRAFFDIDDMSKRS